MPLEWFVQKPWAQAPSQSITCSFFYSDRSLWARLSEEHSKRGAFEDRHWAAMIRETHKVWTLDELDVAVDDKSAAAADAFVAVLVAPCRLLAEALEAVVQDDLRARRRRDSRRAPCGQQHLPLIQTVVRNLCGGVVAQRRRGAARDGVEERREPVAHVEE